MIPYVMGYPPDSVKQTALYRYKAIYLSEIRIQLERNAIHYWMIACDFEQDFESNTTLFLPRPFGHDKFQFTAFNAQITPPDFIRDYQIYSDQFMHAYQVVDTLFVQAFLALSPAEIRAMFALNKESTSKGVFFASSFIPANASAAASFVLRNVLSPIW